MVLEFQTIHHGVDEALVDLVKRQLLAIRKKDKQISRGEVYFRDMGWPSDSRICEIRLTRYRDTLHVVRHAESFTEAAVQALQFLNDSIDRKVAKIKPVPAPGLAAKTNKLSIL